MRYQTALEHFGNVEKLRKAFRPALSHQAVYLWKDAGVVPKARALELEKRTDGVLRIDERLYQPALVRARKERLERRKASAPVSAA